MHGSVLLGVYMDRPPHNTEMCTHSSTLAAFMKRYFGYRYEFLGIISGGIIGIEMIFAFAFVLAMMGLNFQNR